LDVGGEYICSHLHFLFHHPARSAAVLGRGFFLSRNKSFGLYSLRKIIAECLSVAQKALFVEE
jgi:hypothetical protein